MTPRERFFETADELRAEKVQVGYRSVNARLTLKFGSGHSNDEVKVWLREWNEERGYNPVIELANLPDAMTARLTVAAKHLWEAAQAEAAAVLASERRRMEEAVQAERNTCDELATLLRERHREIVRLRDQVGKTTVELNHERELRRLERSHDFWERVMREIHDLMPERDALSAKAMMGLVRADLVQEAEGFPEKWSVRTIRKKVVGRIEHRRYFAEEGDLFRRRRPEDDAA